jgi:hypothetical protein
MTIPFVVIGVGSHGRAMLDLTEAFNTRHRPRDPTR